MSVLRLMNQPMTIQNKVLPYVDDDGYVHDSYGAPFGVFGYLEQRLSIEHLVDRDTSVTEWFLTLPAGTNIDRLARVNFAGQVFEVSGEPHKVWNPRTRSISHVECKLVGTVG